MNSEWKQKWIEALRSGKYEQGKHVLRSGDNKYCCLGVLCDIVAPGAWDKEPSRNEFSRVNQFYGHGDGLCSSSTSLSAAVELEVGLGSANQRELVDMNDNYGADFNAIANYIERNL